jgi:hypothetical protein
MLIQFCRPELAAHAANPVGTHHVDQVANVLHSRHVPNRFLHELLQIERRQPAGQQKRSPAMFNEHVANATPKMRVMFKMLASQNA